MDTTYVLITRYITKLQSELIEMDDYSEEVYQALECVLDAVDDVLFPNQLKG